MREKIKKQPRTTYTSELRQRNLSVGKDYFLGAKVTHFLQTSKKLLYSHRAVHVFRKSATTCASWR